MSQKTHIIGFLYNPYSRKVLVNCPHNTTDGENVVSVFDGAKKQNETPEKAFQRVSHEAVRIKPKLSLINLLYDYLNEKNNTHRYVFFVDDKKLVSDKKLKTRVDWKWLTLESALKLHLTLASRQVLVYFQREQEARTRKSPEPMAI